jgi:hypothetical protein
VTIAFCQVASRLRTFGVLSVFGAVRSGSDRVDQGPESKCTELAVSFQAHDQPTKRSDRAELGWTRQSIPPPDVPLSSPNVATRWLSAIAGLNKCAVELRLIQYEAAPSRRCSQPPAASAGAGWSGSLASSQHAVGSLPRSQGFA